MDINVVVKDAPKSVRTYMDAIELAGQALLDIKSIDSNYIKACIEREEDFPTGLLLRSGQGVAMPHGNSDLVNYNSISVVRTEENIEFGRMEDKNQKVSCKLVFNLVLASGEQHIIVLRKLVNLFQDELFIETCHKLRQYEVQDYISQKLRE